MSVSVQPNTVTKMLWPSKATELPVTRSGQLLCVHTEPTECKVTCCALHPHAEGKFVFGTTLGKVYAVDLMTNSLFLLGDANAKAKESLHCSDTNKSVIYSLAFVGEHRNNNYNGDDNNSYKNSSKVPCKLVEPYFVLALLSNMQIMCIDWSTGREQWPRISCNAHNKPVTKLVSMVPHDFVVRNGISTNITYNNSSSSMNALESDINITCSTPTRLQFICCSSDLISLWQYCHTAEQARWRCTRLVQPVQLLNTSIKSEIMKSKVRTIEVEKSQRQECERVNRKVNLMPNNKENYKKKTSISRNNNNDDNNKIIKCNVDKGNVHDVQMEMPRFINAHFTSEYLVAIENNGIISKWLITSNTNTSLQENSNNDKTKSNKQKNFAQVEEHISSSKLNNESENAIRGVKNASSRSTRAKRFTLPDQCVCTLPFQAACSVISDTFLVLGARNTSSIALMTSDRLQGMRKVNLHVPSDAHMVASAQKNGVEQLSPIGNKWVACQLNTHIDSVFVVSLEIYAVVFSIALPHLVSQVGPTSVSRMALPWCFSTAGCTYALCALPLMHSNSSCLSSFSSSLSSITSSILSNNLYIYHLPTAKMTYEENVLATKQHAEWEEEESYCNNDNANNEDYNELPPYNKNNRQKVDLETLILQGSEKNTDEHQSIALQEEKTFSNEMVEHQNVVEKEQDKKWAITETHINSTNHDKTDKTRNIRNTKRYTLHSFTPTFVSRYVRRPLDIQEIDLTKWVDVDALQSCDRPRQHVAFRDDTIANHVNGAGNQKKYCRKVNNGDDENSQQQEEQKEKSDIDKSKYYYGYATKGGTVVRPRRSILASDKQDKQEVQAWEKLMEQVAAFTLDANIYNSSRNNGGGHDTTNRFTRGDANHNSSRGSKDLYSQYVHKLRDYLKVYGSFPSSYRPAIWRLLLELPPKSCTVTQFAALDRHDEHICVHGLLQPFPLPRRSKERQSLTRALSILAWHSDVLGMASFMPALVYPFVQVFPNDIQSCVEVVLTFCNNWGQDFFSFYPRYPVRLFVFLERVLRMFDAELHAHLQAIGASAEIWGSLMIFSLYTEILTASAWLQVMDHAWSMNPMWLFMFHLCYLISLRGKLLQCRSGNEVAQELSVVQPCLPIARVIVHAHDMYTQCASQYEFSSSMRSYFTFRNFGPQAIYPSLFRCNMSVLHAKQDEWRALRTHWNETRQAALKLQQLSKHAEEVALESELLYEQESARITAKYEAQSQTWHTKMSIEAARTAYEEAMTALQLASIDERTRNAEKLQSLVDHEGQSYLLREMDERTQIQAAAEAKWRNASHAAQSELHKMESEAVLRVRALLQKLHHDNNNEKIFSDHFNGSSIDAGNNRYINDDKTNAFANEGMVHSYMMYNETDNIQDDICDSYNDEENEDYHEVDQCNERRITELLEPEQFHTHYYNNNDDAYMQQDYKVENEYDEYIENEEQLPQGSNELHEVHHSVEMLENTDIDVALINVDEEGNVEDVYEEEFEQKEMNTNSINTNSNVQCEVANDNTESEHEIENKETEKALAENVLEAVYDADKQENGNYDNSAQENHRTHESPVKSVVAHPLEIDLLPLPVMPTLANDNVNKVKELNAQTERGSNGTKTAMPKLYDNLLDNTQSRYANNATNIVLQPSCTAKVADLQKSDVIRNQHTQNPASHHEWRTQQTTSLTNEEGQPTTSSLHYANRNYVNHTNEPTNEPRNTREQVIQSPSRLVTTKFELHPHLSSTLSVVSSSARLSSPSTVHANEYVVTRPTSSTTRHTNTNTTTTTTNTNTERASHANNARSSSHLTTTTTTTLATSDTTTSSSSSSSPSTTRYNSTYNSSSLSSSLEEMEITSTSSTLTTSSSPSPSSSCSITESSNTISTNKVNGATSLQTTANELLHKMQNILVRRRQHLMSHHYHEAAIATTRAK